MLTDRGISPESLSHLSDEEVTLLANQKAVFHISVEEDMEIVYLPQFKLGIMREHLTNEDIKRVIVITQDPKSPATSAIQNISKEFPAKDIAFFSLQELQYNISKHELVPKHILIKDPAEIQNILQTFQVKSRIQLPIILKTDPMARYLDAKPGNIMKITRPSPSSAEYISYRICV
jgi:DNA-directed RNA polymerase I, II, and III subunit RPABC1